MRCEQLDGEEILVVHGLLSPPECEALIARSEALGYETAAVGGESIPELRNNGRAFLEDRALADDLWRRVSPYVPRERREQSPRVCMSGSGSIAIRRPSSSRSTWTALSAAAIGR